MRVLTLVLSASVIVACSSDDNDPDSSTGGVPSGNGGTGSGGAPATGGAPVTGGAGGGAGGGPGTGGVVATGGLPPASGGSVTAGGTTASGGASASGGAAPASGGTTGSGGIMGSGGGTAVGTLPPVTDVGKAGPYAVTTDGKAGANSTVWRPTELGKDGVKHPIFVWGTGSTALPSRYNDHFTHVASHGFVVISPNSTSVNEGLLKASLDWIIAQNAVAGSPYEGKLATNKVAMGGHSLGSIGTFNQEATETRLTTTIHIAGGSFDGAGSSKVKTPTAYICGANGDIALPQCKVDFENVKTHPTFYSELQGVNHTDAARAALPGITAWLRWHLAGETERKAMFTPTAGQFTTGIWKSQVKNW
jgi:hypothetical protein